MRVAVMATGALGGYFGGRLAEAGHEVHFIARGANLAALRANGLKVKSELGDLHLPKINVTDDPKTIGEVDLIFFAVKLWDVEKSGEAAKPLVGPMGVLVRVAARETEGEAPERWRIRRNAAASARRHSIEAFDSDSSRSGFLVSEPGRSSSRRL